MQRQTRQRKAVVSVLEQAGGPLTPHEIHEAARKLTPSLGIATVYRTLRSLAAAGWALQVGLPGETPRYETAGRSHHHFFQCRQCEKVFEVHDCPSDLQRLVPQGFLLEDHEVFLYGQCSLCRRKPTDQAGSSWPPGQGPRAMALGAKAALPGPV